MPALRVLSLYPELMNIYADRGNIAVLRARYVAPTADHVGSAVVVLRG